MVSITTVSPALIVRTGGSLLSNQPHCTVSSVAGNRWTRPAKDFAGTCLSVSRRETSSARSVSAAPEAIARKIHFLIIELLLTMIPLSRGRFESIPLCKRLTTTGVCTTAADEAGRPGHPRAAGVFCA